jgi:Zn-dependent protease with chaperone function
MVFLLGRELGHIMAGHERYQACAQFTLGTASALSSGTFALARLPFDLLLGARLYAWSRASEYTADRAGYLACQNREAALRALMKLSGFPIRHAAEIRTRSLVEQAHRFRNDIGDDALDRAFKILGQLLSPSPYTVRRAAELLDWLESGADNAILSAHTS